MMKSTFLSLVAHDLVKTFGANLSRFTIVFPYSTPIYVFANALFVETNESLTKPTYITISNLFVKAAGTKVADNLILICRLYCAYIEVLGKRNNEQATNIEAMTFDEFYQWGEMMLGDFDDIDKAMVNAQHLLQDVCNLKSISDDNYLDKEQKSVLEKFFTSFGQSENSLIREKYRNVWTLLYDIYITFNTANAKDGITYEGAAFRKGLSELKAHMSEIYTTYVFVGFNAISQAERELMLNLKNCERALFYWDYDLTYCDDIHEAGRFVKRNIELFGNKMGEEHFDNLKQRNPIRIIESPTKSGGISYAKRWIESIVSNKDTNNVIITTNNDTSSLLTHYVMPHSNEYRFEINFPMNDTFVYVSLMRAADKVKLRKTSDKTEPTSVELIAELQKCIDYLTNNYITENKDSAAPKSLQRMLMKQACKEAKKIIDRIESLVSSGLLPAGVETIRRIMQQQIGNTMIAIETPNEKPKEPAVIVKVRDLNETRLLDFDNILVVGCNESYLPSTATASTLIPNHVRAVYGLPTNDNRSAIGAYNFFRVIQRPKSVTLVYSSESTDFGNKEMSRFLLQIIGEDNIPYDNKRISHSFSVSPRHKRTVYKTEKMLDTLERLEATPLYQYIKCPLMFYYAKVARINVPESDVNKMPPNLFGTIFHESAQLFYESKYSTPIIMKETLAQALSNNGAALEPFIDAAFSNNGVPQNAIIRRIVKKYLERVLTYDMHNTPFIIKPELIEKFLYTTIPVKCKNGICRNVRVGGRFDRVDVTKINGKDVMRVVDYKTSTWRGPLKIADCNEVFEKDTGYKHLDYIFQTFLYCLSLSENIDSNKNAYSDGINIAPAVLFITATGKEDFEPYISYGKLENEVITDFKKIADDFRERLTLLLEQIFDIDTPFTEGDENSCTFCAYKTLCNKTT